MNIRTLVLVLVATIHGSRGTLRATLDFELSRTKVGPASTRQTPLMIHLDGSLTPAFGAREHGLSITTARGSAGSLD
jgi:hypothetical protein